MTKSKIARLEKARKKLIVIDASLARAASTSEHPTSSACRRTLTAILEICHCVVMTTDIQAEWRKHMGRFASTWLAQMTSRGKRKPVAPSPLEKTRVALSKLERGKEQPRADFIEPELDAIHKDLLLVEAASGPGADRIVLSLDEKMRKLLIRLSDKSAEVAAVCWINPTVETDTLISWLEAGAHDGSYPALGEERP